jgi:hypothetical protein
LNRYESATQRRAELGDGLGSRKRMRLASSPGSTADSGLIRGQTKSPSCGYGEFAGPRWRYQVRLNEEFMMDIPFFRDTSTSTCWSNFVDVRGIRPTRFLFFLPPVAFLAGAFSGPLDGCLAMMLLRCSRRNRVCEMNSFPREGTSETLRMPVPES